MFEKFLQYHPVYQITERPTTKQVGEFEHKVPQELVQFWKEFGFGNFMNGYLKMVDPSSFGDFMRSSYTPSFEPTTVFAVTAFGDILIWEGEFVNQINYRRGTEKTHGTKIQNLFNIFLGKWDTVEKAFDAKNYLAAVERLGEPAFDECFAYVPALALGGSEKVENIQKVKLREHLLILSQLVGVIE